MDKRLLLYLINQYCIEEEDNDVEINLQPFQTRNDKFKYKREDSLIAYCPIPVSSSTMSRVWKIFFAEKSLQISLSPIKVFLVEQNI